MNNHTNIIIDETISLGDVELSIESIPINGKGGDIVSIIEFSKLYDLDRIKNMEAARINKFLEDIKGSGMDKDSEPLKTLLSKYSSRLDNITLNYNRTGIIIGDVMGHGPEKYESARDLSKWFELAADFEIERYGQITKRAIEKMNNMFYKALDPADDKSYVTMIYGEIYIDGTFRFVSAGHPKPIVYSKEFQKIIPLPENIVNPGLPLGLRPSYSANRTDSILGYEPEYHINSMKLESPGDIFIIHTDGLSEHKDKDSNDYHPANGKSRLEEVLKRTAHLPTPEIASEIREDLYKYGKLEDDVSYVIIKKRDKKEI